MFELFEINRIHCISETFRKFEKIVLLRLLLEKKNDSNNLSCQFFII